MKKIYLDNNATTQIDPRVLEAMVQELQMGPSNPSSIHSFGRAAKQRLMAARETIADCLGVLPQELIFTSSGTEALNLAIQGACPTGGKVITSKIEHAAVYHAIKNPHYLPVSEKGHIEPQDLIDAITFDTRLITLGAVNGETGVKNPLNEIAEIAAAHKIPLIIDGVALLGKEPFSIHPGISAMAFSGHKLHGPTGVGLLVARKNFNFSPIFHGGGQERMKRPGTENLPGIIGLAKAIEILDYPPLITQLRDHFETSLKEAISDLKVNGTGPRVGNTSNLCFPDIDAETLLIHLDQAGIAVSMGSACSSGALEPSRVLLEMGCTQKEALSSIRFSLSRFTNTEEIKEVINTISTFTKNLVMQRR